MALRANQYPLTTGADTSPCLCRWIRKSAICGTEALTRAKPSDNNCIVWATFPGRPRKWKVRHILLSRLQASEKALALAEMPN